MWRGRRYDPDDVTSVKLTSKALQFIFDAVVLTLFWLVLGVVFAFAVWCFCPCKRKQCGTACRICKKQPTTAVVPFTPNT